MESTPNVRLQIDAANREAFLLRFSNPGAGLELAIDTARRAKAARYRSGFAYALRTAGANRCVMSDLDPASSDLAAAHRIFVDIRDELGQAHVLLWQGNIARRTQSHAVAMGHLLDALESFRTLGDRAGEAIALIFIGYVQKDVQACAKALDAHMEARRIAEELGDAALVVNAILNMAACYGDVEEFDRSCALLRKALGLARAGGYAVAEVLATGNLAIGLRRSGSPEFTPTILTGCLASMHALGLRREACHVLRELGEVAQAAGDLTGAARYFRETSALGRDLGDRLYITEGLLKLGEILRMSGDFDDALVHLNEALAEARAFGSEFHQAEAHRELASLCELRGDPGAALVHYKAYHKASSAHQRGDAAALLRAREEVEDVERIRREAKLRAILGEMQVLKAQMQPHFLLNSLNAVATLIHCDTGAADAMLVALGDLLRLALRHSAEPEIILSDEIQFATLYLTVEQMRLERTVRVRVELDPAVAHIRVPNLILQPLVENSVRHGQLDQQACPEIVISARRSPDGMLTLAVRDNGVGIPENWRAYAGIGLRNTIERISGLYGSRGGVEVSSRGPGGGTHVSIRLPVGE